MDKPRVVAEISDMYVLSMRIMYELSKCFHTTIKFSDGIQYLCTKMKFFILNI